MCEHRAGPELPGQADVGAYTSRVTGATDGDGGADEGVRRPSLAAVARDRRVWLILAIVAGLIVCCCSAVVGALIALSSGLLTA